MVLPQFLLPILLPGGKKKFGNCDNAIAENEKKKKKTCYEICERVKKSCHVHNIFTTFSQ